MFESRYLLLEVKKKHKKVATSCTFRLQTYTSISKVNDIGKYNEKIVS